MLVNNVSIFPCFMHHHRVGQSRLNSSGRKLTFIIMFVILFFYVLYFTLKCQHDTLAMTFCRLGQTTKQISLSNQNTMSKMHLHLEYYIIFILKETTITLKTLRSRLKANYSAGSSEAGYNVVTEQMLKINTEMLLYFLLYMCAFGAAQSVFRFLKVNVASKPNRLHTRGVDWIFTSGINVKL